ncbi:hypothetical protein [Streptomyces sp. NPDC096153]|uniref:hypothetical protein n=1 Tax=Streptomyces sp. NPDC096153 TaxID=3155548 RepID=UPI003317C2CA
MSAVDLPIPVVVTRFKCRHCGRTHAKRPAAVDHIGRCWRNPGNRGCKTCAHFQEAQTSSHQCIPGYDCGCDSWPEACCHPEGPEQLNSPVINCEHWEARP